VNHTTGADLVISSPCIIGEGAVIERLRRNIDLELDPFPSTRGRKVPRFLY
jgi:homocysteine S-methyltransferase